MQVRGDQGASPRRPACKSPADSLYYQGVHPVPGLRIPVLSTMLRLLVAQSRRFTGTAGPVRRAARGPRASRSRINDNRANRNGKFSARLECLEILLSEACDHGQKNMTIAKSCLPEWMPFLRVHPDDRIEDGLVVIAEDFAICRIIQN